VECATPLEAITRVVDRINSCLESFLVHVAPDRAPDEAGDIRPTLRRAFDRVRPLAEQLEVRLVDEIGDPPALSIHPAQLEVAIESLLDNAVRACRRGGAVTLRARLDDEDLRLEVLDEGEGMAPDLLKRAVEIGYSCWGRAGIGLAVAKFIAYAHGGGFQIESHVGRGTRVCLVLPV
jgi:signal transduction histidine kinase